MSQDGLVLGRILGSREKWSSTIYHSICKIDLRKIRTILSLLFVHFTENRGIPRFWFEYKSYSVEYHSTNTTMPIIHSLPLPSWNSNILKNKIAHFYCPTEAKNRPKIDTHARKKEKEDRTNTFKQSTQTHGNIKMHSWTDFIIVHTRDPKNLSENLRHSRTERDIHSYVRPSTHKKISGTRLKKWVPTRWRGWKQYVDDKQSSTETYWRKRKKTT